MNNYQTLTTISDFYGSGHQRIFWPGHIFNKKYGDIFKYYISESDYAKQEFQNRHKKIFDPYVRHDLFSGRYSCVRFKRFITYNQITIMKSFENNLPQVVRVWDIEDDVFAIEPSNELAYNFYKSLHSNLIEAAKIAHRVVVCNENQKCGLVERGIEADKIVKVQNVLFKDFHPVKRWKAKKEGEPYRFVWFGSASYRGEIIDLIIPAMEAMKKAFPNAEFYIPDIFIPIPEVQLKIIELGINVFPWQHPQDLGRWLHEQNFDFGFHLAHNNTFNRARCSSKIKEMLFSGATLPITFEKKVDKSGYVSEIRNPSHDDMIDYVRTMMDQDTYKKELRKLRKRWYGKLWFEDFENEYEELFLVDVMKKQGIIESE